MPCALCEEPFNGMGHNPEPLGDFEARVCEACNKRLVIPARLGQLTDAQVLALRRIVTRNYLGA